jgi:hypothetical protein
MPQYTLRLELEYIAPPIWRQITVPSAIRLPALHDCIQIVMGWEDCHLHAFQAGGQLYDDPRGEVFGSSSLDERRVRLETLLKHPGDTLVYIYDWGDEWRHQVRLESIAPSPPDGTPIIHCLDGARACPPEDAGGPPGYEEFLATLAGPPGPARDEYLRWTGGAFDPERFDRRAVNIALNRKRWRATYLR